MRLQMQVKILRDPSKPDKAGKPTSRGMGFAEFASHEHALCALRQLNNNPTVFGEQSPSQLLCKALSDLGCLQLCSCIRTLAHMQLRNEIGAPVGTHR